MRSNLRVFMILAVTGCGGGDSSAYYGGGAEAGGTSGSGSGSGVEAGQLTAGEWDDAANLSWFEYMLDTQFSNLRPRGVLPLDGRMIATVTDEGGLPIAGATIEVVGTDRRVTAGTDGRVLLLPGFDGGARLRVTAPDGVTIETDASETLVVPGATGAAPASLDLAFVVDATGSMSDEIQYLQAEIRSIAARVAVLHPDVSTRYGLVMYRDTGDDYVTRVYDFSSLDPFHGNLLAQSAGGGGDYPEAAERAMHDAIAELGWRDGNVARVLFHVADAPPHDGEYSDFLNAALSARTRGIRIFPVAASGVALEAEYLMRSSALATLGRYVFLTDDSGIGNSHEEPRIPCYRVELLATVLARTIDSELTGAYIAPSPENVIRSVGYDNESCILP